MKTSKKYNKVNSDSEETDKEWEESGSSLDDVSDENFTTSASENDTLAEVVKKAKNDHYSKRIFV